MRKIESHPAGLFAAVFLTLIFIIVAYVSDGWTSIFNQQPNIVGSVLAFTVLQFLLFLFLSLVYGVDTKHKFLFSYQKYCNRILEPTKNNYNSAFLLAFAEEFYCRWFWMGKMENHIFLLTAVILSILTWYCFLQFFYTLQNLKIKFNLPDFICGIFYAYIFTQIGFWPTLFVHFFATSLIMMLHKLEDLEQNDMIVGVYSWIMIVIAYCWLHHYKNIFNITDLLNLTVNPNLEFTFLDLVFLMLLVTFTTKFISCILMLDFGTFKWDGNLNNQDESSLFEFGNDSMVEISNLKISFLLYPLLLIPFFIYWVYVPQIIFILTITLFFFWLSNPKSGSSAARSFLITLPRIFMINLMFQKFGFLLSFLGCAIVAVPYVIIFPLEEE